MRLRKAYQKLVKYGPVPDVKALRDELWSRHSELVGIDLNEPGQLELLRIFSEKFKGEYEALPRDRTPLAHEYYVNNTAFSSVDGEILYCMIRHFKPRRIIEIGSGFSTLLAARAVLKNEEEEPGRKCELTAIEPDPKPMLRGSLPGLSRLLVERVEHVEMREFESLAEGDILFIDSSHVLKIGSDVQYEYLEILPRLGKAVLVHSHDIFLPAEYPREGVLGGTFWNEQYLLHGFLLFNEAFEVLWAGSYMHLTHPDKLEEAFSSYNRATRWPGSFWMRKVR
jgi:hypothetical protein